MRMLLLRPRWLLIVVLSGNVVAEVTIAAPVAQPQSAMVTPADSPVDEEKTRAFRRIDKERIEIAIRDIRILFAICLLGMITLLVGWCRYHSGRATQESFEPTEVRRQQDERLPKRNLPSQPLHRYELYSAEREIYEGDIYELIKEIERTEN